MIIYEVNLKVSNSIISQFKIWLNEHIKIMLTYDGFVKYKIFDVINNEEGITLLVIHYYIETMKHYDDYISKYSYKMRDEGEKKFKNQFEANRRILKI